MPLRKLKAPSIASELLEMRSVLASEFRAPREEPAEPVIVMEDRPHGRRNIYVIWSEWAEIDMADRSEVIMDAYEDAFGLDECLNIAVATGLTASEAERFGIEYE